MMLDKEGNFTLERDGNKLVVTHVPTGQTIMLKDSELYELSEAILAWLELIEFEAAGEVTR